MLRKLPGAAPPAVLRHPTDWEARCCAEHVTLRADKEDIAAQHPGQEHLAWHEKEQNIRIWSWNRCVRSRCINLQTESGLLTLYSGKDYHLLPVTHSDYVDESLLYEWWGLLVDGGYVDIHAFHTFMQGRLTSLREQYSSSGEVQFACISERLWYTATWTFLDSMEFVTAPIDPQTDSCLFCGEGECPIVICDGSAARLRKDMLPPQTTCPSDIVDIGHSIRLDRCARQLQCRLEDSQGNVLPHCTCLPFNIDQRAALGKLGRWAIAHGQRLPDATDHLDSNILEQMYEGPYPQMYVVKPSTIKF